MSSGQAETSVYINSRQKSKHKQKNEMKTIHVPSIFKKSCPEKNNKKVKKNLQLYPNNNT